MEYTINQLAELAGVSTRTLRYYDEIGILKPARINSSGYRIYGQHELDRLQQILFYRELGVELERIKEMLTSPSFDVLKALKEHYEKLLEKKDQLDLLINNVLKSINAKERGIIMSDQEKFDGFKKKMVDENEQKYGKEIREKYGEEVVKRSNQRFLNMTKEDFEQIAQLETEMFENLLSAFQTGDPASNLAQKAVDLHRQWLSFYWDSYTKEAHMGVAQLYVEDARFKEYYDKREPGLAEFFRNAIDIYTEMKK